MRKSLFYRSCFFIFILILWFSSLFPTDSLPYFPSVRELAKKTISKKKVKSQKEYENLAEEKESLDKKYNYYQPRSFKEQEEYDKVINKYYSFISQEQEKKFYKALTLAENYYKNQKKTAKEKNLFKLSPANALIIASDELNVKLHQFFNLPVSLQASNKVIANKLSKKFSGKIKKGIDISGGVEFILSFNTNELEEKKVSTDDLIAILKNRVDSKGLTEAEIRLFGTQFIQVRIPVIDESEIINIRELLSQPANLEFRGVYEENPRGKLPLGTLGYQNLPGVNGNERYNVKREVEMTGFGNIDSAYVARTESGSISVVVKFTTQGAEIFSNVTRRHIKKPLAIILDGKVYSAPIVQQQLSSSATITGNFSREEAENLAIALQSGSLPVKLSLNAESIISATLGEQEFSRSMKAGLIGFLCVLVFLILYYRHSGFVAAISLISNVVFVIGTMSIWGAAFTLPGIAGIILTIGMAVDANVLIFESIKEQLTNGNKLHTSISLGFKKAFTTIFDANITTLLIALVLIYFGSGAIKGFAYTLSVGIIASVFSSLFLSKIFFDYIQWKNKKKLSGLKKKVISNINFLKYKKITLSFSLCLAIFSLVILVIKSNNALSIDFVGGTQLSYQINGKEKNIEHLKKLFVEKQFESIRLSFKQPFGDAPKSFEILLKAGTDSNENINLINKKLKSIGIDSLLSKNTINPLIGKEFTKSSLLAILIALIIIFFYISFRFENIFAWGAIIALIHDALISLGIFVILGNQISIPVIAAILTIIGYSLNDTIVVFDNIREQLFNKKSTNINALVNKSINKTLSRTLLTSLTTLFVVILFFLWGEGTLKDFALILILGIISGTYSSIFLAAPIIANKKLSSELESISKDKAQKELDEQKDLTVVK